VASTVARRRTGQLEIRSSKVSLDCATIRLSANTVINSNSWYLDSGASGHMVGEKEGLIGYTPIESTAVRLGNDSVIEAKAKGSLRLTVNVGDKESKILLPDVYHVHSLTKNLLSPNRIVERGTSFIRTTLVLSLRTRKRMKFFLLPNHIRESSVSSAPRTQRPHLFRQLHHFRQTLPGCELCAKGKQQRKPIRKGPAPCAIDILM